MEDFNFHAFWNGLNKDDRVAFAEKAGVTVGYIRTHLSYARRQPGLKTIRRLHLACIAHGAAVTMEELIRFFE